MRHYTNSDYALNKYSKGIVYRSVDGIIEITLEEYLQDNPCKTMTDFYELKEISDSIYLTQVKNENAQTRKDTPLDYVDEALLCLELSPEEIFIAELDAIDADNRYQAQLTIANQALDKLTAIQCKRYLLHIVDELTTREIAALEGVAQQVVNKSILAAKKKIKNFFAVN